MPILFFFISLFVSAKAKPAVPPLKIAILYYTPVAPQLKTELIQNIKATYNCKVTEIKGIATMPAAAYYKPRNRYRASLFAGLV